MDMDATFIIMQTAWDFFLILLLSIGLCGIIGLIELFIRK